MSIGVPELLICGLPIAVIAIIIFNKYLKNVPVRNGIILVTVAALTLFAGYLIGFFQRPPSATSSLLAAPKPSALPTVFMLPATKSITASPVPDCLLWSDISAAHKGETVCVWGVASKIYNLDEYSTRINFSNITNSFFILDKNYIYPDLKLGGCVLANGIVKQEGQLLYLIVDGKLNNCGEMAQTSASTQPRLTIQLTNTTQPTNTVRSQPTAAPQSICPQGCINPPSGCVIKGNIGYGTGEKIYHLPGDEFYDLTVINPSYGERWFCTIQEAKNNGWRSAQ